MRKNIFTSLARYANRQEENFLTEAFVYLINFLLETKEPSILEILQNLFGKNCHSWFSSIEEITIDTQLTITDGRPDIVLKVGDDRVAFIEVKHDSVLGQEQLERYYDHLKTSGYQEQQLVLLTRSRHSIQETSLQSDKFHHVCWYEISGWLSDIEFENEITIYLVNQFLDFLSEKDMNMEKIKWEYIEGVPALVNLTNMIGTAIAEALPNEKIKKTAGWNWIGYYIGEGTDLWTGVRYKEPLKIIFENNNGNTPTFQRYLSLPESHFFSLSSGEQLESLIKFIKESYSDFLSQEKA